MKKAAVTVAIVLIGIIVLALLRWTTPGYAVLTGPIETAGRQGTRAETGEFSLTVDKLILSELLIFQRYGKKVERGTGGVWAVVAAEVAGKHRTLMLGGIALRGASGRIYMQSARIEGMSQLLSGKELQPGLQQRGLFVFELPADELAGAELVVSREIFPRLTSQLAVALDEGSAIRRTILEIGRDPL
ncbi:hypothetical protein FZC33_27660 [Labrys sp. KNU-23]|uniref:hypothetical protein n=1 Tax=Labrys sp. KNU-23 TaxID=2789216 RepID=UPI0011EF179C|nr:hypothetical protein [Labrys sp. KNU-23]QEN89855.1 hypothetical protein FZC33_27660 [Labrys sp. KNU-23]